MDVGQATQIGLAVGGLATGITGIVVAALNRRTARDTTALSQAELDERQRQYDVSTLIAELRKNVARQDEHVERLEVRIEGLSKEHEAKVAEYDTKIEALKAENAECWADRAQLTNQVTYQRMQLDDMRRRVAQLEKPDQVERQGPPGGADER